MLNNVNYAAWHQYLKAPGLTERSRIAFENFAKALASDDKREVERARQLLLVDAALKIDAAARQCKGKQFGVTDTAGCPASLVDAISQLLVREPINRVNERSVAKITTGSDANVSIGSLQKSAQMRDAPPPAVIINLMALLGGDFVSEVNAGLSAPDLLSTGVKTRHEQLNFDFLKTLGDKTSSVVSSSRRALNKLS